LRRPHETACALTIRPVFAAEQAMRDGWQTGRHGHLGMQNQVLAGRQPCGIDCVHHRPGR